MPAHRTRPPLNRGEVYGCWTVLRETTRGPAGQVRYMCRASCCGREVAKPHSDILRMSQRCLLCKGDGKGNFVYGRP